MTSKRHLSTSLVEGDICQVCGDKARLHNYGALSCSSCKTFFRRHGFNIQTVPTCSFDGNCLMTIQLRRSCTACRFAKCLAVGMSSELIRKEDLHEKYRSINKSRQRLALKKPVTIPQPCLLNLLSTDQSSLTSTNWRLLSNIVHAFDTYNSVPNVQKIVYLISNQPPNADNSLNMIGLISTALQSFVSCTADFRIMTISEQCSLFQRNIHGLLAFYCIYVFRESGVFDNNHTENAVLPLYGYQNVQSTKYLSQRLENDPTLIKLMLATLAFSSNCFTINRNNEINDSLLLGTFRLFGSQNVYVELLWKYMLYRYDFLEAVRRFNGLIKSALNTLRLASDINDSNKLHQNFINDVKNQCEHALKLNGSEDIPLWGKDVLNSH